MKIKNRSGNGFTLIELLITISIIGVMMAIGVVAYTQLIKSSRDGKRQSDLKSIQSAIEQFHADYGYYPAKSGINFSAGQTIASGGRVYLNAVPLDPLTSSSWRQYCYEPQPPSCTGSGCINYFLYSKLEVAPGATTYSVCSQTDYNIQLTNP